MRAHNKTMVYHSEYNLRRERARGAPITQPSMYTAARAAGDAVRVASSAKKYLTR